VQYMSCVIHVCNINAKNCVEKSEDPWRCVQAHSLASKGSRVCPQLGVYFFSDAITLYLFTHKSDEIAHIT
jgi:hypothetical protein